MASKSRFKTFLWVIAILCVVMIAIQFVRTPLTNPPVTADLQVPLEVKQILETSCYNCHSNETKLPWFDKIVPAYWLVTKDVTQGRQHLNFSEIGALPAGQQKGILYEAVDQIELGAMPPRNYTVVHPEAVITSEKLMVLRQYLNPTPPGPAAAADISAADAQYAAWLPTATTLHDANPAPNGVPFQPDYKNWKAISSTDRLDNKTMRVILGNDIVVKAIAENRINPWPDGSSFAKVAWFQQPDDKGFVRTGAFFQVEFMIRDSKQYASTSGWGWGRWRGTDLKPYGKDATFVKECIGCHLPMVKNDMVFTMPIKGQQ